MVGALQSELDAMNYAVSAQQKTVDRGVHAHPIMEDVHQDQIMDELASRPPSTVPNRLHIGVAGFFNLEIAAYTRPDAILLLDYNKAQEQFWHTVIDCLASCENINDFYYKFAHAIEAEYDKPDGYQVIEVGQFSDYLLNMPWFNHPEGYHYFHQLAKNGKIMASTIDLAGKHEPACELGAFIKKHGFHVDTCYWSNIGQFLQPHLSNKAMSSHEDPVHVDGLDYSAIYYDRTQCDGPETWDGEEYVDAGNGTRQRVDVNTMPPSERFLRNVSAIAGETGLHMFTSNQPDVMRHRSAPSISIVRDEHGRVSIEISGGGVSDKLEHPLMLSDGPPRRTPEKWVAREDARAKYDAAVAQGLGAY